MWHCTHYFSRECVSRTALVCYKWFIYHAHCHTAGRKSSWIIPEHENFIILRCYHLSGSILYVGATLSLREKKKFHLQNKTRASTVSCCSKLMANYCRAKSMKEKLPKSSTILNHRSSVKQAPVNNVSDPRKKPPIPNDGNLHARYIPVRENPNGTLDKRCSVSWRNWENKSSFGQNNNVWQGRAKTVAWKQR